MVEIHRQKYFLTAKAATNPLPRRPPFLCVFKTSLREAYRRLGTETSPAIGFNCLLPVGQIWWRSEVTQFFTNFLIIGPYSPIFTRAVRNE